MKYDLIIIGSGPGGYVAAIRASQLGKKVAVIEKESIGGICLNWGCIPTKALLKSAQVFEYLQHASDYGISAENPKVNFELVISRSRDIAGKMSKGVEYLFKKNKIDLINGFARIQKEKNVEVSDQEGKTTLYEADHIIIATGARSRELPNIKLDGKKIIGYRQAMNLPKQPKSMVVIGSGAIGSEFAYFYNAIGTEVSLVEIFPEIVPLEDIEVSKQLARSFKKKGIKIYTDSTVEEVDTKGNKCKVKIKTKKGDEIISCDMVLSAVGISTNIENMGLEEAGVKYEKGKVIVDEFYKTNLEGVYAIGDIVHGPALAHVASAEGIICVEKIAGENPQPLDYGNIPACTYTNPEIASVGFTEKEAKDAGYELKIGKFPFSASGKASAAGHNEGFVKLIFDAKYGECLGAHMIGTGVTELIAEMVAVRKLETTGHELIKTLHPHPTMSEAIMEAAAAAFGEVIHI
ncbi:MAG: dihydrolipoyl dehydrogenase [Bacteroidetes bacterium]|nr:dihydrolipoyl dehydrogenase [Bacteroidota bacterium]